MHLMDNEKKKNICIWIKRQTERAKKAFKVEVRRPFLGAPFAVGVFSTWQVASQRNHYMREEKGGNKHTCGCARSPTSVLRSQSLHPPGEGVAKGERQREERKGEEGRDCGGDLQAS